jgi:hypothetical protein
MFGDQPAPLVDPCILVMELAANGWFAFGVYVMFHYNFDDHIQLSPMPEAWGTDQGRRTLCCFSGSSSEVSLQLVDARSMEPIRGLKETRPLNQSILLDYLSPDAITTIIRASANKHFCVAWLTTPFYHVRSNDPYRCWAYTAASTTTDQRRKPQIRH